MGVLASRSPHRPNAIGLSVVKLDRLVVPSNAPILLQITGIDLLDGTPVLDIKPYLPYCDSVPKARVGWANEPIKKTQLKFTVAALKDIKGAQAACGSANLKKLITEILAIDPRPAFQRAKPAKAGETHYGFGLLDYDVKWEPATDGSFLVTGLGPLHSSEIKPATKS